MMTRKKKCKSEFRSSPQPTNGGCPRPPRQINIEYTPPSNVRKYDGADRQTGGRTDGRTDTSPMRVRFPPVAAGVISDRRETVRVFGCGG